MSARMIDEAVFVQSQAHLKSVLESRASNIENLFKTNQRQVANLAADESIVDAVRDFTTAFNQLESDLKDRVSRENINDELTTYYREEFGSRITQMAEVNGESFLPEQFVSQLAQWVYIVENPNPIGMKNAKYIPDLQTRYHNVHNRYHKRLNRLLSSFDFYDVFLFDQNSRMVYSSFKETDFATDFYTGPYAKSNLANVVRRALNSDSGSVVTSDVAQYAPSYFDPASFFAAPVYLSGNLLGAVAFQISNNRINRIVADHTGLRKTGETYIVGDDLLMRTDSRFNTESTMLKLKVDTEASRAVNSGQSGFTVTPDYRGINVLSHYRPLNIDGLQWGMLAEIDEKEVRAPSLTLVNRLILTLIITLGTVATFTYLLFRLGVERQIKNITFTAEKIIEGDYSARTPVISKDEFATIANSQNAMAERMGSHIADLEKALHEVKELKGLLPICAYCKSIRDSDGYFRTVESYLVGRSNVEFSHCYCEACQELHFPDLDEDTEH